MLLSKLGHTCFVAISTPVAVTFDWDLGICFFTDVYQDYIYKIDVATHNVEPYIDLKKYSELV